MAQPDYAPVVQRELTDAEKFLAGTSSITIKSIPEADTAASYLKQIKTKATEIEGLRVKFVKPLNEHVKLINAEFKKPLDLLGQAEAAVKRLLLAWDQAERKRIADEEARLREEARKKEEVERAKLLKRAETAEAKGKEDKADELRQQAAEVSVPAPALAPAQRAVGIQVRKSWDFEITDAAAIPREYLTVNETAIRKVVGALKGETKIPGIRVYEKESVAA